MFVLLITAAAVQTMAPAVEVTPRQVNSEGVRAVYTRSVDEDGTVHLRGFYRDSDRSRFHYRVKGRKVVATIAGVPDRFEAPSDR